MATIEALRAQKEKPNPAFALAVICTGYFMVILDATVTNVALPSIGRGLHGSVTGLQWVVDAYTLSFAGLLLTGGALAERLGGRRIFAAGLIVFGAASAACGLAPTLGMLPLSLFRRRMFRSGSTVGLLINLGFYGQLFVMSLYFQDIRGYSALQTGLALLPEA